LGKQKKEKDAKGSFQCQVKAKSQTVVVIKRGLNKLSVLKQFFASPPSNSKKSGFE
jgi:hypothetical protein